MHDHHSPIYDVIIAGAGPVGLFLACELRLSNLSVLVLERAEDPDSPLKRLPFGMRGLSAPTLEAFYRRGLLEEIVAAQSENSVGEVVQAIFQAVSAHTGGAESFDDETVVAIKVQAPAGAKK